MQPLCFHPILKRIRWGGTRLGSVLGKPIGDADDYAESWEIADHGDDQSIVADGELAGETLHRLVTEHADALLGRHAGWKRFPLLIKFLDAHDRLSLQVHPDDHQAPRFDATENGKTEAWVILEADPHSLLYAGLQPGVDRARFERALADGHVERCLHSFTVKPGDCVYIPAGTIHAIGEGILLAEIQQTSDLTFRVHDWGRTDSDGKPRLLHISDALQCIDFERGPIDPAIPIPVRAAGPPVEELVRCDHFVLRRHASTEPFMLETGDRFHALIVLDGRAELVCDGQVTPLSRGRTVLLPAAAGRARCVPAGKLVLLEACLP